MSLRVMASGVLYSFALKVSAANKNYGLAKVRVGSGDAAVWPSAFIFGAGLIEEFERLQIGEPVTVCGELDAKIYAKDGGEPRISLSIKVDAIISTRAPKRERRKTERQSPTQRASARETADRSWAAPARGEELSDDLPF
jgi:hypothetical protein